MKSWVFSVQNYPDSRPSVENCPAGKSPSTAAIEPLSGPESRASGSRASAERLDCGESRRSLFPPAGPCRPHATIVAIAHPLRLPARYGSSHGPRFARPIAPRSRHPEPNRGNTTVSRLVPSLTSPTGVSVGPFQPFKSPTINRPPACTYGMYLLLDQYVLVRGDRVYPIVDTGNRSCLPDSRAHHSDPVYPTENSRIHSLFVENSPPARAVATTRPQEPRDRPAGKFPRRPAEPQPAASRGRDTALFKPTDSLHSRAS